MTDCCEGCKNGTECTWPTTDSWACEQCATPITEDEHRVWGNCESCERNWCDKVDAVNDGGQSAPAGMRLSTVCL